jgi:hypothetical protein
MQSIPGMAQRGLRVSGWLTTVAAGTAMTKIGINGVFVRICSILLCQAILYLAKVPDKFRNY